MRKLSFIRWCSRGNGPNPFFSESSLSLTKFSCFAIFYGLCRGGVWNKKKRFELLFPNFSLEKHHKQIKNNFKLKKMANVCPYRPKSNLETWRGGQSNTVYCELHLTFFIIYKYCFERKRNSSNGKSFNFSSPSSIHVRRGGLTDFLRVRRLSEILLLLLREFFSIYINLTRQTRLCLPLFFPPNLFLFSTRSKKKEIEKSSLRTFRWAQWGGGGWGALMSQ